ncbi:acyltransferase family protein [Streptococcus zalophi]|uniref:acyltransferase family protein n=1 Tax=Streptococcus zalophi TaxID=640031 RepID=UPI00215CE8B7|nr:acyltransferase family protein [Streptococcus zalophi]MCR8968339.1 acyltransferase [Streptococcus zalophi]
MRIKWFSVIRITGLLLVLLYHFFRNAFPGGFIGVDIFFTFSGYLITALLIDEFSQKQSIDLLRFFRRRFYRIFPPLVLLILIVLPLTLLVKQDFVADIGRQVAATLGFTTNIYELLIGGNYESQFIPHLFLHTWSLAIEVHFYIIWGFLTWLLSKRIKKSTDFRRLIFLLSTVLFVASFLSMFVRSFFVDQFSTVYFSTLSHSYGFFLGAMFATMTGIQETTKQFKINVRSWQLRAVLIVFGLSLSLILLLSRLLDFNHVFTYLFGFILTGLFTAVMIYASRVLHEKTPDIKEPKAITFLSDISYSIYLFHWPLYIIFTQLMNNWAAVILTTLLSVAFASLSFYVIEPIVSGRTPIILGLPITFKDYSRWFIGSFGTLVVISLFVIVRSPKVGAFETDLLVNSLKQADTNMDRTHMLAAGDASAISDIMIIGDSVSLRASDMISQQLPEAQLDAAISRNFPLAFEIYKNHIDNKTLSKTVVLAVGVNSPYNYQAEIMQFVDNLPEGHRLVLVTPYNVKDGSIENVRNYELELAKQYDYIEVADWYQASVDNPNIWAGTDGVHFSISDSSGSDLYAQTIKEAIETVARKQAK